MIKIRNASGKKNRTYRPSSIQKPALHTETLFDEYCKREHRETMDAVETLRELAQKMHDDGRIQVR